MTSYNNVTVPMQEKTVTLPYFPFYPKDFEAKTSHLTLEEDGAYNRLLRLLWMSPGCSIPDDDLWIMRRLRVNQETFDRVVKVILDEFFERKNGKITSEKLNEIYHSTNELHKKRVLAGSKGGKNKSLKNNDLKSSKARVLLKPGSSNQNQNQNQIKKQSKDCKKVLKPDGFDDQLWNDFLQLRKIKKAPLTKTALDGFIREADKAGVTLETAIRVTVERGWQGFKAEFVKDMDLPKIQSQNQQPTNQVTIDQKSEAEAYAIALNWSKQHIKYFIPPSNGILSIPEQVAINIRETVMKKKQGL